MQPVSPLPIPARRALRKLGQDIKDARAAPDTDGVLASAPRISRSTLTKVEKGDEFVAIGIYAAILSPLGLVEGLGVSRNRATDAVGQAIDERNLPNASG